MTSASWPIPQTVAPPEAPAPAVATAAPTAILLVSAAADGERPVAALECGGATVLERLLEQLEELGVGAVEVLARPRWEAVLEPLTRGRARLRPSPGPASDVAAVAAIARAGEGALVLAHGDILADRAAIADVLAGLRRGSAILAAGRRPEAFDVRAAGRRVLSAASPYHGVAGPTGSFLGVLALEADDRPALAEAAERLAPLLAAPSGAWAAELDAKARRWRATLPEPDVHVAAAPDDVPALLLVALLRAGARIHASALRALYWARPLSRAALARAERELEAHDEDAALLAGAVKAGDGFFTTFFVSSYSWRLARRAARWGLTPNQLTTCSLLVGAGAAAAFAVGTRGALIAGAVLLYAAFALDCVDGQLARYTRRFSTLGAWLDSVFDRAKEYLAFAGLAIGAARAGGDVWLLAAAALLLQTVRHSIDFSFPAMGRPAPAPVAQVPLEQPQDGGPPAPAAAAARQRRGGAARLLGLARDLDRVPAAPWLKSMLAFPIGERFAVISLTAALATPRLTFQVVLAWGGFAALYTLVGRLLRSAAR